VACVAVVILAGCTLPSRTAEDYEADAAATAEAAISDTGTALLTARAVEDDRLLPPSVAVVLRDAETGLDAARATFASIQPPDPSSDDLRDELLSLIDPAADVIAEMRIAARRVEPGTIVSLADELREHGSRLEAFVEEHGPA
jgi:hypothetical protein